MVVRACILGWALWLVACSNEAPPLPPDPIVEDGSLSLTWMIRNGNTLLDCLDVGAVTVTLTALQPGQLSGVSDSFSCDTMSGRTRLLTPGTYNVSVDLSASASRSLLSAPLLYEAVEIMPARDASLGLNTFNVEPTGALRFSVVATDSSSNCDPGGSAITDMVFRLENLDGSCVPASYQVDNDPPIADLCDGNFQLPCVASNQTVRVAALRSGPTRLEVTGQREGGLACYQGALDFIVPGNALEADIGAVQMPLDENILACSPP